MDRISHDRLMEILADALELPAAEREAFLDRACGGDAACRAEVERLLAAEHAPDPMPTRSAQDLIQRTLAAPTRLGAYKIIRELGRGGMGVVYLAEQERPVRRSVAIKLIQVGMHGSAEIIARFESERQALAMMSHPNVARVFDAGVTDTGRQYFVMEYAPGETIIDYCDGHGLGTRQRLELFLEVCDAVQHAHQKGIIHRDLKPGNVLVTSIDGKAVPKVIDFGIAKAIERPLTEHTYFTEHGRLMGTPEYMSPEQASMDGIDIDTRTDVYALGVLLYELLAGVMPFDRQVMKKSAFDELRRLIREVDPPRPSTRLSQAGGDAAAEIARNRKTEPGPLVRALRGELDWITMKALEKDRSRRYASAAELAADLRRYLENQPVLAGPPSTVYRMRKFVRRHRVPVVASMLVVAALVAAVVGVTWQAVIARRAERDALQQKRLAERRLNDVRKLADALIFDIDDAIQNAGPTKAREQLVETARKYLEKLEVESPDDAQQKDLVSGYLKLGNVQYYPGYPHLGQPAAAQNSYARALAIAEKRAAARPNDLDARADVGRCYIYLARAQAGNNQSDAALETLDKAKSIYQALAKQDPTAWRYERSLAIAIDHSSDIYRSRGDPARTRGALEQVQDIYERLAAAHPQEIMLRRDVMVIHSGLAGFLLDAGLPPEGASHARQSLQAARELLRREPDNPQYARDVFNETHLLVHNLLSAGFAKQALDLITPVVGERRKVLADDPSNYLARRDVATALRNYGDALHLSGRFDDGIGAQEESLRLLGELHSTDPDDRFVRNATANVHRSLALMHLDAGQIDRALEHATQAVTLHRELSAGGRVNPSVCNSLRVLAEVKLARGDLTGAIAALREAAPAYAVTSGTPPPEQRREYIFVLANLGEALRRDNQPEPAAATLKEGLDLADALLAVSPDDLTIAWWRASILLSQARLAQDQKDNPTMAADCDQAIDAAKALVQADSTAFHFQKTLKEAEALRAQSTTATKPGS